MTREGRTEVKKENTERLKKISYNRCQQRTEKRKKLDILIILFLVMVKGGATSRGWEGWE